MKQKNRTSFRKILAGLCIFCMVCMTYFGAVSVHAKEDVKLTASDCIAERGKTISVTLNLEGNPGIWGLKFKVGYDHSALKLTSVTNGTVFSEGEVVLPESLDKEQYVFLATAEKLENISADGEMVTLKFEVAEEAAFADYPVSVEITQAINVDGKEVSIAAKNGSVKVQAEANPPQLNDKSNQQAEGLKTDDNKQAEAKLTQLSDNGNRQAKEANTGDNNHLVLWIVIAGISGGAMLAFGIFIRKKRWIKA